MHVPTQPQVTPFTGFPPETLRFLRALARHNDRTWFEAHAEDYEHHVGQPSRAFVWSLGLKLARLVPGLVADPRAHGIGSISRLQRDTRFAKDKTPYRTHLGILFWQGRLPGKWDNPGFHVAISATQLTLTGGLRTFPPPTRAAWREAVCHGGRRRALRRALEQAPDDLLLGGRTYKRGPRGLLATADNEDLLRHSGLFLTHTENHAEKTPPSLHTADLVDHCASVFRGMAPVVQWLAKLPG